MNRRVVLGIDSGTQSTKALALDVDTGEVVSTGRAPHSGSDIQVPDDWWQALRSAVRQVLNPGVEVVGISVSGQQHGCVLLDVDNRVIRPAPLWNNIDSASDADRLNGLADFPAEVGLHLVASFTITKLAHLARTAPNDIDRAAAICLPHDWLNLRLTGQLSTDRGDASGTGWWSPRENRYRRDLLALAAGDEVAGRIGLPVVRGPEEPAGILTEDAARELGLPAGIPVGPGSGDNMAAALGIGAAAGELVMSLGTSGTVYTVSDTATNDPDGEIAGFADATGRFLPLACMINCTRVVDIVAAMFGIDREEALNRAGSVPPGAGGLVMLPYLGGERTPNLPHARGVLNGMADRTMTPDIMLRAALDGVAAGLAYCVDALARCGVSAPAITLVGGAAGHPVWQQVVADATGLPVTVRTGIEHAARGAGIQAAAIVRNEPITTVMDRWRPEVIAQISPRPGLREAFALETRRAMIAEMERRP
ncbi:MAG TPA: xylulokinase [Thermomicrobiales bacterium]|nr:xylulokinase [Thermomicrobiales bacterium]